MNAPLPIQHLLLALAVVAVWGSNFIVIKLALAELPPLAFAALRFLFAALPAAFLLPRPRVPWRSLAAYGVFLGVGQFALMYLALTRFISPGLASLVLQMQIFFTIALAMGLLRERVERLQWIALAIGASGIGVIAAHTDGDTTPLGLVLTLGAALGWASANIVAKRAAPPDMLAFVVWASAFAVPPLLALSLGFEGWPAIRSGLAGASVGAWGAVLFQSWANMLFGYSAWGWLLARHPVALISPLSLLVPVIGMSGSALLLAEPLPVWKLIAAALVLGGLAINVMGPRIRAALA